MTDDPLVMCPTCDGPGCPLCNHFGYLHLSELDGA